MAVSITKLTRGFTDDVTSTNTASITPSANKLVLLAVSGRNGLGTEPATPTISGNGLTWVLINSIFFTTSGFSRRKLFLYRAMGASPSSGAITINFGETTTILWAVAECTGMDTSGTNGSGAIVQSATAKDETNSTNTLTVTLGAFGSTNNATFGCYSQSSPTDAVTPGSGFTELEELGASFSTKLHTEFKDTNDTSVDWTSAGNIIAGGIGIEIKAAVATAVKDLIGMGIIPFAR